ncbi:MAG TPA: helix-turn-helix domain-containing protein [Gemmatimonadaceae bacterium]
MLAVRRPAPRPAEVPARVVAFAPRPAVQAMVRSGLPRRHVRLAVTRTLAKFRASFAAELVDVAVVDLDTTDAQSEHAMQLAREFPTVGFLGITAFRAGDAGRVSLCADLDFADVLAERIDGGVLPHAVAAHGFSARFATAFAEAPAEIGLTTPLQAAAWRCIVARAGRPVLTQDVARILGLTREHLSRTFAAGRAPTLKRVIDLVRLLAAAELAKSPGYAVGDVARLLGFASSSHLSATAQRVIGAKASSLVSLRGVEVIGRFRQ